MTARDRHTNWEAYEQAMDLMFTDLDSSHDWLRERQPPAVTPLRPHDHTEVHNA